MFGEAWYTYVRVSLGPVTCTHERCPAFTGMMLTGEVAGPIRMRISCEDNRVTDLVVVEVVKDAVAVRAVAIPGILSRCEVFEMENEAPDVRSRRQLMKQTLAFRQTEHTRRTVGLQPVVRSICENTICWL